MQALLKLHWTSISTPSVVKALLRWASASISPPLPAPQAVGAPRGSSANLIAIVVATMLRRSVSAHRRRAMSRRYEPPFADVTAIQNFVLASSRIVELNEDYVMKQKRYVIGSRRRCERGRRRRRFGTLAGSCVARQAQGPAEVIRARAQIFLYDQNYFYHRKPNSPSIQPTERSSERNMSQFINRLIVTRLNCRAVPAAWHCHCKCLCIPTTNKLECKVRRLALALLFAAAFGAAMVATSRDIHGSFACDLHDQAACSRLEWRAALA
jgi:hypothetical protein